MVKKLKILVTGSNGQLGQVLKKISINYSHFSFIFFSKDDMDISNSKILDEIISNILPDVIINCAAFTNVELAEKNYDLVNQINNISVDHLAKFCSIYKIRLIHISTDFVFDGNNNLPYTESDNPKPINNYGRSKFLGENSIFKYELKDSIILRTSWLYSVSGNNFVTKIVNKVKEGKDFNINSDEIGSPTSAHDLANAILFCIPKIKNNQTEIFHFSNLGYCSRLDFAQKISNLLGYNLIISRSNTVTNVKRPKFSPLSTKKFIDIFDYKVNEWETSLKNHISKNYG
ncbi:MAG: dTDP-4-dehydrorhamnose reductase [Flavobacteriaceae bacterium]|nr:dTDP-4-dehydrorhamnose reductase [Flavobacteriaceae bacterium]